MVRVNGTCIFKEDNNIVADLAPAPPSARQDQIDNAVQITLADYQNSNYTLDADVRFKDSVVKLLNDFCNENTLRPQDCGVEQNQLFFNEKLVKRLPGYPEDSGNNAIIKFYVDYPSTIFINKTLDKTILASIVFAELAKFEQLISLNVTLDTSVLPETPGTPTANEISNAVQLKILDFSPNQWTIFYDTVFRRSVALALNKYCRMDNYSRSQDCGLTESQSFNNSHIKRLSGSPSQSGGDVLVSFYVDHPSSSDPVLRNVLASMLVTRETDLEIALSQQVEIQTSAEPANPPVATSEQTTNSVVIRIASFGASQWTYLYDRRLRKSIAKRIAEYCSANLANCQVQSGGSASFSESDVQRSSAGTPTNAGSNNIDYSFYVTYPGESNPITKNVLASIVYLEIEAMQSESSLFFSLQTSLELPAPTSPNADQSSNTVVITILGQQANQWHSFVDNKWRAAIATQVGSFCAGNLVVCGVSSDQVSFGLSNVTRIAGSPVQDGDNVTYTFFVNYPSGNKTVQRNLLAGILAERLAQLRNATELDISLKTSTLAPKPSSTATADQISNAVNISARNVQAEKWSAIQDLTFRGYVAQAITEFCQASQARNQECELPSGQSSFTSSHVKLVNPGNPEQNGANAKIEFFVEYPGGGTVSQAILLLIMNEQLSSIQQNTGLQLTVLTTVEIVTEKPPTVDNTQNAIKVVLKDFQADQWSLRDGLFRENMANAIKTFCARGTYHRNICNISEVVSNAFTADNIQRLPDSPTQNGTDSILSFYATLPPDGSGSLPKSVLATIFTSEQEDILSLDSELENPDESVPSSETPVLTTPQRDNLVPITIFNFKRAKFTTLVVVDIRVTVAARMNIFCFSTTENVCGLFVSTSRRRKRAAGNQQFSETDVIVDANVTESGNNTVVGAVVNEPGTTTPVKTDVVEDALHQTLQENGESDISSLTIGVVNTPTVSETQENNAASVRLTNTNASQWTLQQDISFRHNMSQAIIQFCGESDARLASCNLTRAQVDQISFQHIQILPNSPTQDGNDAILSFFVNLPDGTTMSSGLVSTIYSVSANVLSKPSDIVSTSKNTNLTRVETENLIQLTVEGMAKHPDDAVRLDIQVAIADRLKEYCGRNSGATICPTSRAFTNDDIVVQIDQDTRDVSFVVKDPDNLEGSPISSIDVQEEINGNFTTKILGLKLRITRLFTENAIHVVLKNFQVDEPYNKLT
ncbi:uncharacterized protein LOC114530617 [Dendronephthya gigantea]|uniref:uncharacterized protein LOC114530617 n=1 Tax=Dendronephthya gigantea TaxID=151771 RepID=UPI00106ADE20|nr:uncharacterized protein LOC114530617 [Dendronephthya gigantea]